MHAVTPVSLLAGLLAGAAVLALGALPLAAAARLVHLAPPVEDGPPTAGGLASLRLLRAGGRHPHRVWRDLTGSVRHQTSVRRPAAALRALPGLLLAALLLVVLLLVLPAVAVLGPAGSLVALVAVLVAPAVLRRRAALRADVRERAAAVEACTALAAELRAGRSPAEALQVAAGVAREGSRDALRAGAAAARLGGDVAEALRRPPVERTAVPEVLRGLAACWKVCSRAGSGLAAGTERLAESLRARQAQQRATAAALAGPRASAAVLALLPLAGVALAAALGADPAHVLLRTPLGGGCLLAGLALDAAGLVWTTRLVTRAEAAQA